MIDGKSVIGIIPARGGSKGLPRKNLLEICGKPLIAYSIEAGLESRYIDYLIVSTDSEEIRAVAKSHGADVPYLRPSHLAQDNSPTIDSVIDILDYCDENLKRKFDLVVLLEPTSPIRELKDIDNMLEILSNSESNFDAIVSIGESRLDPSAMWRVESERLIRYCNEHPITTRRQDSLKSFFPYGVAYISKTESLLQTRSFYPPRTTFYELQSHQCFEIDDKYDFMLVNSIINERFTKL